MESTDPCSYQSFLHLSLSFLTEEEQETEAALEQAGKLAALQFTPSGTAGIFALYAPAGSNLGNVFANEFFCVCIFRASFYG